MMSKEKAAEIQVKTIWHSILETGVAFGSEACRSTQNYISKEFALNYNIGRH